MCPEIEGERGELQWQPGNVSETRVLAKALSDSWPISESQRIALIQKMVQCVLRSNSERERLAAFRALIQADGNNILREKLEAGPQPRVNLTIEMSLAERAAEMARMLQDAEARRLG
jgi:hypothetical protein